jgi:nuclease S1
LLSRSAERIGKRPVMAAWCCAKGGNTLQVRWFDRGSNLHRVWDSGIIDHTGWGEDGWLAGLIARDTDEARGNAQMGTVEDWATESLLAAREAYQDPTTGQRMKPGAKMGEAYQAQGLPVAKRRLYQAGARLAWVLNEASGRE